MDVVTTDDDDDDDPLVCPTCQGWLDRDQPDARRARPGGRRLPGLSEVVVDPLGGLGEAVLEPIAV